MKDRDFTEVHYQFHLSSVSYSQGYSGNLWEDGFTSQNFSNNKGRDQYTDSVNLPTTPKPTEHSDVFLQSHFSIFTLNCQSPDLLQYSERSGRERWRPSARSPGSLAKGPGQSEDPKLQGNPQNWAEEAAEERARTVIRSRLTSFARLLYRVGNSSDRASLTPNLKMYYLSLN